MAFYHHSLLVSAIRMLCGDEITDHGIDIADAMLVYVQQGWSMDRVQRGGP